MKFLGQDPRQRDDFRNIIVIAMVTSISGILIPTVCYIEYFRNIS